MRHHLESFDGRQDPQAVPTALPYLGHADRYLPFAARIALEHKPGASWQELVFSETHLQSRLTGLLALTRVGKPRSQAAAA